MENEKEIKNESTKPYELLAQIFGTTPEELQEGVNESAGDNKLSEDLRTALSSLSPRERDVLRLRFGLDDGRKRTLEEVGVLFGVSRYRIRQIEANAIKKLKEHSENK